MSVTRVIKFVDVIRTVSIAYLQTDDIVHRGSILNTNIKKVMTKAKYMTLALPVCVATHPQTIQMKIKTTTIGCAKNTSSLSH